MVANKIPCPSCGCKYSEYRCIDALRLADVIVCFRCGAGLRFDGLALLALTPEEQANPRVAKGLAFIRELLKEAHAKLGS